MTNQKKRDEYVPFSAIARQGGKNSIIITVPQPCARMPKIKVGDYLAVFVRKLEIPSEPP